MPESSKNRRVSPWRIAAVSLVLVGVGGFLAFVLLGEGKPTAEGTTTEATRAATLLLDDYRAPAGIASVFCQQNTDDWASSGLSPYRCEVIAQDGTFLCDAGDTLSEGYQLECDEASHYEAIKAESLALAQRALDVITQDARWGGLVASLARGATYFEPLCNVERTLEAGLLGDAITVLVYSPLVSTGAGVGAALTVSPEGQVEYSPYTGSNLGDALLRPESRYRWGISGCSLGDRGIGLDGVLIRPGSTAGLDMAPQAPDDRAEQPDDTRLDGSTVAPELADAYEQGLALGRSINESLEGAGSSSDDDFDRACQTWVENALRDGVVSWPNRLGTESLRFNPGDQHQAQAFASGCSDGRAASHEVPDSSPTESSGEGSGASDDVYIPDDWAHNPESYAAQPQVIASGSAHWYDNLTWSGWGSGRAVGTGLEHSSDCTPSCANGTVSRTPITIVVSNLGQCLGRTYYRSIRVIRPDDAPSTLRVRQVDGACYAMAIR